MKARSLLCRLSSTRVIAALLLLTAAQAAVAEVLEDGFAYAHFNGAVQAAFKSKDVQQVLALCWQENVTPQMREEARKAFEPTVLEGKKIVMNGWDEVESSDPLLKTQTIGGKRYKYFPKPTHKLLFWYEPTKPMAQVPPDSAIPVGAKSGKLYLCSLVEVR